MTSRPKALFVLNTEAYHWIYDSVYPEIARLTDVYVPPLTARALLDQPDLLQQAEILFSGWGSPTLDAELLEQAPNLKIVFHGAGSIKRLVSPEFWQRGIVITSAAAANAVPVAEFTLAQILLGLKGVWYFARAARDGRTLSQRSVFPGGYGSTVGLISLGMIGRRVRNLLKPFDLKVLAYDPLVTPAEAVALDIELTTLDDVFRTAHVVSLHTPWLPKTEGMITGDHFRLMQPNSTFINTARGAVVRETEMIEVLAERSDITAILDVTYPEPPVADSLLYSLPNVVLTPHIAGAVGGECRRMGELVLEELRLYLAGKPPLHPVRDRSGGVYRLRS